MLQDTNLLSSNAANNRNPSGDNAMDLIKVRDAPDDDDDDDDDDAVGGITVSAVETIVSIISGQDDDDMVLWLTVP